MKKTLLQMVQSVMSDMDSDEVTSITDTVESAQVASTIQDVFDQFIANDQIPELQVVLNPDNATNKVQVPIDSNVREVLNIRLRDINSKWSTPKYLRPDEFLDLVLSQDVTADNVEVVGSPELPIVNDVVAKYWTSFDDQFVWFNSYDLNQNSDGYQSPDVIMYVSTFPVFTQDDDFVIPVDENLYPYLLAEAKATCFVNLKQQSNPKIESQARRQRVKIQHGKFRTAQAEKDSLAPAQPCFGRGRP